MIAGTFEAIALWAKEVIEDFGSSGTVWDYNRDIATIPEFIAAFGTGTQNSRNQEIVRGWIIDVANVEVPDDLPMVFGNNYIHSFTVNYLFVASYEDYGANRHDVTTYIENVVNELQSVARPTAFNSFTNGGGNRPLVDFVNWNITTSAYPDNQPNPSLLVWRVEGTQEVQLVQPLR